MNKLSEKIDVMRQKIESEKGGLDLLAMFVRDDVPTMWDLVVAATWLKSDNMFDLSYIAKELSDAISKSELESMSRIVILPARGSLVTLLLELIGDARGEMELPVTFSGSIIHANVVYARHAPTVLRVRKERKTRTTPT